VIKRVVLKKGAPAPFDGYLLSAEALATLAANQEAEVDRLQARIDYLNMLDKQKTDYSSRVCELKLTSEKLRYDALREGQSTIRLNYESAISNLSKKNWYESPYFNFILGAAITGVSTALIYHYYVQ
jgi:hypothetical protein